LTSYWKLINMEAADVIAIGTEKQLTELKLLYENKMDTKTKMIKCFGKENFDEDWRQMRNKCKKLLKECDDECQGI